MVRSIKDLRGANDEQLIAEHDELATNTVAGTAYYTDELRRREAIRAEAASYKLAEESHNLARRTYWLTVASFLVAAVAAVAAIAAIFVSIALAHSCG